MIHPPDPRTDRGCSPAPARAHRKPGIRRNGAARLLSGLMLMLLVGASRATAAGPLPEVENVRVGFGPANAFKIGTWTPVWVQLKGGSERFSGFMDVVVADDDGTPTSYRQPVDVAAGASQRFTAYSRPGGRDPELTIRLFDSGGRRVVEAPQTSTMPATPDAIMPDEIVDPDPGPAHGGGSGPEPARLRDTVTGTERGNRGGGRRGPDRPAVGPHARALVRLRRGPGDRDRHRAIPRCSSRSTALRGQALVDWVKRGGHLVVAVGANWQAVRDSVLAPILPGLPGGPGAGRLARGARHLRRLEQADHPPGHAAGHGHQARGGRGARGKVLSVMSQPAAGRPRALRLRPGDPDRASDVDQKLFADWPDRGLFWARASTCSTTGPTRDRGGQIGGAAVLPVGGLRPGQPAPRSAWSSSRA